MELIGLTGYKQSGKDTYADVLINEGGFVRLAFADALKKDVADYCGVTMEQVNEEKAALRRVLQLHGVAMRQEDPGHWVDIVEKEIKLEQNIWDARIVITDVRFPDEAEMIRTFEGRIFRMRRADQPEVTEDAHESETNVDLIEADAEVLCNSIAQRQEAAREYLRSLRGD